MASRDALIGEASKLEGIPNYAVWSFKLLNILNREDIWRVVDPPAGTVAPIAQVDIDALQVLKNRALTLIALSVKDNVIPYIANITEPDECWKVLKDLYASGSNSRKRLLRRKLSNLRMDEGAAIAEFLKQVKELVNEFACIKEIINDSEILEQILMALPESYEGLVSSVMYRPTLPTVVELTVILLQDDIRREIKGGKRSDQEALLTNSKKSFGGRRSSLATSDARHKHKKNTASECHYCGSKEHWMRNCPTLAADLKARKAKRLEKSTSINVVDNFDSTSEEEEFLESETDLAVNMLELNLAESSSNEWFIDSGASKHVTGQKSLLSDLDSNCRSKISTAGGHTLNVAGKESVEVSTPSGGIQIDNVLYVPGIRKNLLSVGSIADGEDRPKILFDSTHCWILRDFPLPAAHQVITKGKRDQKNGLYKF